MTLYPKQNKNIKNGKPRIKPQTTPITKLTKESYQLLQKLNRSWIDKIL